MRKIEIKKINGTPAICIDGKVYPPPFFTVNFQVDDNLYIDENYFENLGKAGIKIFFVITDTEWTHKGSWKNFDLISKAILKAVPDALIMSRVGLDPPDEWIKENPQECFTYNDGSVPCGFLPTQTKSTKLSHICTLMSQKWREKAGEALLETCRYYESLPYADRIVGFLLCAGGTSEWYYVLPLENENKYGEFSEGFGREFEKYLRRKYKTEDFLKEFWRDENASFSHPVIYGLKEREFADEFDKKFAENPAAYVVNVSELESRDYDWRGNTVEKKSENPYSFGNFLNVDKCFGLADFYQAFQKTVAESIIYFGSLVKEYYKGNILTGAFFSNLCTTIGPGFTNIDGTISILKSDVIDFLATPGNYHNRQPGFYTGQRMAQDSFRLRDKICFIEDDTRTHAEYPYYRSLVGCYDMEDTINVLKRDFGRNICEDVYSWWLDQIIGGGRYKSPEVYTLFKRQHEIARYAYMHKKIKDNEIALIYDEESVSLISAEATNTLNQYFRDCYSARVGAGIDYYYHNDMEIESMPDYKLYIFANVFCLNKTERETIRKKLSKNKATAVWLYASGVIDPDEKERISVENIYNLTGFKVGMVQEITDTKYRISNNTHPYTKGLDFRKPYGWKDALHYDNLSHRQIYSETYAYPYFYPNDEDSEIFAVNCVNQLPAVAIKDFSGFKSIFYASKVINAEVVRAIARASGCHIYCETNDVVYVGPNFITIHISKSGTKRFAFKKRCSPYEVYQKKYYGKDVNSIEFEAVFGETYMFCLDGEI